MEKNDFSAKQSSIISFISKHTGLPTLRSFTILGSYTQKIHHTGLPTLRIFTILGYHSWNLHHTGLPTLRSFKIIIVSRYITRSRGPHYTCLSFLSETLTRTLNESLYTGKQIQIIIKHVCTYTYSKNWKFENVFEKLK